MRQCPDATRPNDERYGETRIEAPQALRARRRDRLAIRASLNMASIASSAAAVIEIVSTRPDMASVARACYSQRPHGPATDP